MTKKFMGKISKDLERPIIDDFAQEIRTAKSDGPKPQKTVIDFRDERINKKERKIQNTL